MSLAKIQEVPKESLILLTGPPGAGKSTFCHQAVLNGLAMEKPVIYVTTEHGPSEVTDLLKERGAGEFPIGALSFIDAFGETVGATTEARPDTVSANCEDLNSISMAIAKLQERIGRQDILLSFDSLTSPYLFNEKEVFRFMRLCLAKFASEGNSVLALMDEGCGKEEDLVAMMSVADGILRMDMKENLRTINVVKHPKMRPTRIEVPTESERIELKSVEISFAQMDPSYARQFMQSISGKDKAALRREAGDFVNLFWPQFAHWSGMLWDAKRFPTMIYDLNKQDGLRASDFMRLFGPWQIRLLWKLGGFLTALGFFPKSLSRVKDMKKMWKWMEDAPQNERSSIMEYLANVSKTDEHYFRVYENADCTGFENVGIAMASHLPAEFAGMFQAGEEGRREWNAIETKCIGLGDAYCEFKFVPGPIVELKDSLKKDSSVVERIHERLMECIMRFLLEGKPLVDRPRLGSDLHLHPVMHGFGFPNLAGERYRMALRMGGARSGKMVGERLTEAGLNGDETIRRVISFMEHCKVGKVTLEETIRIRENCEPLENELSITKREEPCCFFTTGFLNGLFSSVKNQHVRETKCIAAGDPYCEWEII
jgi:predicted hydrocarbon binding protein/KaiC/GvpD/RAD55 family RecA-like ATPase